MEIHLKHYIADKIDSMLGVKIRKGWDHGKRPVMTTRGQCNRECPASWPVTLYFLAYFSRNKLGIQTSRFVKILKFLFNMCIYTMLSWYFTLL